MVDSIGVILNLLIVHNLPTYTFLIKTVFYLARKDTIVVRTCQLENTAPCNLVQNRLLTPDRALDHCSICHEDDCNGASGITIQWGTIFSTAILAFIIYNVNN